MANPTLFSELPVPPTVDPDRADSVWRVPYEERAAEAEAWAREHGLPPAADDTVRIALILVDVQNTFCVPGHELYVGGRSGTAAVEDNRRLARFVYRNLGRLTTLVPTMDTHQAMQVFHSVFLIDADGNHPAPYSQVSVEDVRSGAWRFNPRVAPSLGITPEYGQRHLEHYCAQLAESGKLAMTVWPYHAMLGGIGHALVSPIEEAVYFHTLARSAQADIRVKGRNPLTEHYSVLGPEVETGPDGERIGQHDSHILDYVRDYDAVAITGQAKSHCVAWTVEDLLGDIRKVDPALAGKVYLIEDCTSPVVAPGMDFTDDADAAFARFAEAGMHRVTSDQSIADWPGLGR